MTTSDSTDCLPTRARSITRWACVLVSGVAVGIAAITIRVVQLKVNPDPRLVDAMQDEAGKLAQQRSVADALPRGEILDRFGRTLALDTMSGSLYIDLRDMYVDTMARNESVADRAKAGKSVEHDRVVLDPISELAAQLGPVLGLPQDEVVRRISHRERNGIVVEQFPAALRTLPPGRELSKEELAQLPQYIVIEKNLNDEQIRLLRAAKEAGGPRSIVRAAYLQPKQERVQPYGVTAAPIIGRTGIDFVDHVPLAVDLRSLFADAGAYNLEALARIAEGEDVAIVDDPLGELAATLAKIVEKPVDEVLVAIGGPDALVPDVRLRQWAMLWQCDGGIASEALDELPTQKVVLDNVGATARRRFATARAAQDAPSVLAYATLLPGTEGVVGRSGVEQLGNDRLSSKPGFTTYFASRLGSVISIPPGGYREGDEGESIRLSIDVVIQEMVEQRVNAMVKKANASGGRALVADAESGEILAAYSTMNSHTGREQIMVDWGASDPALARMRWATDPFEPGSIFKAFVWAWATDQGFARPEERIPLPDGPTTFTDGRAKRTIREAHQSSYGTKTWEQVLVKSVNAGMTTVAFRMGNDAMRRCLGDWKFGESTDIGIQSESAGLMPRSAEWSSKTRALTSVSFGQGIAVTTLQLVRAFTAFCRDGDMVPLSLRPMDQGALSASRRVLSHDGVATAKVVMEKVITEGTGKKLKEILQYRAFGKSGTAQLTERGTGRYYSDKWLASFIAGAPYDRPEIVVLVTIEDPDRTAKETGGATGGGAVAGPVAAEIINDVLGYMGVPPDANGELVYAERKDGDPGKARDPKKVAAAR